MTRIARIALAPAGLLSVYLLIGAQRAILVDTGIKNSGGKILDGMARHHVRPADISLILLTHGHADHAGSVAELRKSIDAPVAIAPADAVSLRAGANTLPPPHTVTGAIVRLALGKHPKFPAYDPDVMIDENFDTATYGVPTKIVRVPGHTPGMIALMTEENEVIAGDALAGQPFSPKQPSVMYLHEDHALAARSLRQLAALRPQRYHVGHGGPLDGEEVARWLERDGDGASGRT